MLSKFVRLFKCRGFKNVFNDFMVQIMKSFISSRLFLSPKFLVLPPPLKCCRYWGEKLSQKLNFH